MRGATQHAMRDGREREFPWVITVVSTQDASSVVSSVRDTSAWQLPAHLLRCEWGITSPPVESSLWVESRNKYSDTCMIPQVRSPPLSGGMCTQFTWQLLCTHCGVNGASLHPVAPSLTCTSRGTSGEVATLSWVAAETDGNEKSYKVRKQTTWVQYSLPREKVEKKFFKEVPFQSQKSVRDREVWLRPN